MHNYPMRILQVVTYMQRGGLETMLMNYYRKIDRERIQFDFLEHREEYSEYDREIESLGGKIFKLPRLNPLSHQYTKTLKEFFEMHKEYQIVHSHMNCMSGLFLLYAKESGVPVRIAHSHNTQEEMNIKYPIKMYYKKKLLKGATDFLACGEEAGKWLFGGKEFLILNNAIETENFVFNEEKRKIIRKRLGFSEKDFVVGHVGSLSLQKNHSFLIDIFFEICKIYSCSKLLLIGQGELQKQIEEKAKKMHLEKNIIFYGESDEVGSLLSAMDAFVFPSLYEGLPLTLIEAQTSGLKCFISDTISQEAVLTEDVKVISLNEEKSIWAEEILDKAKSYSRKDRRREIIEAGYDVGTNVRWLENYYINKWNHLNK